MSKTYPQVPQHELEALAQCLFPTIQDYFQSEEGQREFEAWKQEQKTQGKHSKQ